jgi:3D (Asp-Asp-Asp) domain-containing protein
LAQWPTVRRPAIWGAAAAIAAGGLLLGNQPHRAQLTIESPSGVHARVFWTLDRTWRSTLKSAGVKVGPHDWLSRKLMALSTQPLVIRRAVPLAISTFRGHMSVWTTDYRVGQVLASLGIRLGRLDSVRPPLDAVVRPRLTIQIVRRWLVVHTVRTVLAYHTQYRADAQLFRGNSMIVRDGHDGRARETIRELIQNGRPVRRLGATTRVLVRPVNELIAYGTLDTISRGGSVVNFSREITMTSTAYWPDPTWSHGFTATGMRAQYGVVAVDPSVIPLGSHVYVPGYGFAIAADTGSAIVGDRIDLCYNDAQQAVDWGVRTVDVFILR